MKRSEAIQELIEAIHIHTGIKLIKEEADRVLFKIEHKIGMLPPYKSKDRKDSSFQHSWRPENEEK